MPNISKHIFNKKNLDYLVSKMNQSDIPDFDGKMKIISKWCEFISSGTIYQTKETSIQGSFLNDIFSVVLGYASPLDNPLQWNLNQEQVTNIDGKFADGSLGFFSQTSTDVKAVIELKDGKTNLDERQNRHNDTRTPIEQAFSYQHKIGKSCKWVIVSNFIEIRLYHHSSSTEYEVFNISQLKIWEHFRRFYFLLSIDNLIAKVGDSNIDILFAKNEAEEVNISKQFYSEFKQARVKLFEHLKEHNPNRPDLFLLEKTQKFLDRFIFVSFCEDNRLLPEKVFKSIIDSGKKSFSFSDTKIWNELKGLFHAIDVGSPPHNINKFNGGLFASDPELDSLTIKDSILESLAGLTDYDFETDVDVNILGHIFEQSINDLEEMKNSFEGKEFDKKTSKRKKDGIYYTPEYITKYIVENAVGGWLEDRKKELGFYELPELQSNPANPKDISKSDSKKHLEFWEAYKEKLMNIKVLDPACGSGAFLNQAFNFLYAEGQRVNDKIAELLGGQYSAFGLDKHILVNNLFGVDLNNESVEITKLSLWIKTANRHSELTALDDNIKCGNSLIDDPAVAGDKAFNWFKEFPNVFPGYRDYSENKKENEFQHVTLEEIKSRKLQEPTITYDAVQSNEDTSAIGEPSYSYSPGSKGYEKHGFDVVIGNPPYGAELSRDDQEYFNKYYITAFYKLDSYSLFLEKAISLLKLNGYLGFIVPYTFLTIQQHFLLREIILKLNIQSIINLPQKVFESADLDTVILIINNIHRPQDFFVGKIKDSIILKENILKIEYILNSDNLSINLKLTQVDILLLQKIRASSVALGSFCKISQGLIPYDKYRGHDEFTIKNRIWHSDNRKNETYKKEIQGGDISRYLLDWNGKTWISYGKWLAAPRDEKFFTNPRVLIMEITRGSVYKISGVYTDQEYYNSPSIINIIHPENNIETLKFVLSFINSKLYTWYHLNVNPKANAITSIPKILVDDVRKLPIPNISPEAQQPFIAIADIMLEKNKELQKIRKTYLEFICGQYGIAKPSTKLQDWYTLSFDEFIKEFEKAKVKLNTTQKFDIKELFDREKVKAIELKTLIEQTDNKIDTMVYELYGLTEDEIKNVEGE